MARQRVCAQPGCPAIQEAPRCRTHARAPDSRPSAAARGYGSRWRRTRAAHLSTQPFCTEPGCHAVATDVDHIDGLGPNGPRGHDPGNLRSYCHSPHPQRTARDQPGGWNQR